MSLDSALAWAARVSPALRAARAAAARADGVVRQARGAALPQVTATAGYQRLLQNQFAAIARRNPAPPGGAAPEPGGTDAFFRVFASPNTVTLGLQGSLTVWDAGRTRGAVRSAAAGRTAAEVAFASARAQVAFDATQQYADAALADRLVAIAESSLVQAERGYRLAALDTRVGRSATYDALRARVARDAQFPALAQARAGRTLALARLRRTLALPADAAVAFVTALEPAASADARASEGVPSPPAPFTRVVPAAGAAAYLAAASDVLSTGAPEGPSGGGGTGDVRRAVGAAVAESDTAVAGRAAVRQARAAVDAQRAAARVARADRLPALSVSTAYQRFAYPAVLRDLRSAGAFYPNWTAFAGVQVPLYAGGRLAAAEAVARATLAEAEAQLALTRDAAAVDAEAAIADYEQALTVWRASAGSAEQASRAYTIAEVRFREGLTTQVELSDARLQGAQAASTRARAARDLLVARTRLALLPDLALGTGVGGGTGTPSAGNVPAGAGGSPGAGAGPSPQAPNTATPQTPGTAIPLPVPGGRAATSSAPQ